VIVAANGERIDDRNALRNFEGLQAVGSRASLDVLREGKPLQLGASLREQPRAWGPSSIRALDGATFAELPARCASRRRRRAGRRRVPRQPRGAQRPAAGRRGGGRDQRRLRRPAPASAPASHGPRQGWCSV
jgi:hypothetical protein